MNWLNWVDVAKVKNLVIFFKKNGNPLIKITKELISNTFINKKSVIKYFRI